MKALMLVASALLGSVLCLGAQTVPLDEISGPDRSIADPLYGISAHYPSTWIITDTQRWGDQATTISFRTAECSAASPALYYRAFHQPLVLAPSEVQPWLQKEAERKVVQRLGEGTTGYHNIPGSFEFRNSEGLSALKWTAEYKENGEARTEYLTAILSEKGLALFFMRSPTEQIGIVIPSLEQMIATFRMP